MVRSYGAKKQWNNNNIPQASKLCYQENNLSKVSRWSKLCIQRMENNEISWNPKLSKLSLMCQIQHSHKLSASFPTLYAKDKHNYNTRSATHNLLDIPLTKTNICGKNSIKNLCIRDSNNLKREFSYIPYSELSLSKIKSYLKQKYYDKYWTLSSLSSKYHTLQSILAII